MLSTSIKIQNIEEYIGTSSNQKSKTTSMLNIIGIDKANNKKYENLLVVYVKNLR